MGRPIFFKSPGSPPSERIHQRVKPEPEPEPSCVSFKSNRSKGNPLNFKSPGSPPSERIHLRPEPELEPEPSCLSFKSDMSKGLPINFKSPGSPPSERVDQQSPEVPSVRLPSSIKHSWTPYLCCWRETLSLL
ncbi:PREDICTED: histone-lysine N-methyltransferase 2D-like isoform X3 [Poecilia mexicana]|uniref:histone-lysine N-methyltransferase 2D-like isoform X3 n=1 Tax=Poecilia mexicana TaxID=48701 RepID=UPI00072EC31E|nr:PREDICTED: histone-lysine N-methyltransferase 2D-like isoform X3 [Poecilia mexicana]